MIKEQILRKMAGIIKIIKNKQKPTGTTGMAKIW